MSGATGMPHAFDAELLRVLPDLPVLDLRDLAAARRARAERTAATPPPDLTDVEVEDRIVGGAVGVRLYRPRHRRSPAAVLHVHGGGFVLGDVDMDHPRCVELCRELGILVVSVEYALAPEHPFPRPVEDVRRAWRWLSTRPAGLDVDPQRIALHGISAGAALATGVALRAGHGAGPRPAFLHLASPVLDDRMDTPSMAAFTDTPIWHRANAALSWRAYLGGTRPGSEDVSPEAAPARARDLGGLPPTYLAVMEFDPLRDEALAFAAALVRDGVPTEAHLFPGTFHASVGAIPAAGVSRRQLAEEIAVLKAALVD